MYSYAERKKDAKQGGYGTEKMRLGKDAIKAFDCCSLTLQPTKRPVITPQGYIFDKEAIFSFILEKKKTYEKQLKEYERQKQEEMNEFRDKAAQEEEEARERFEETEKNIVTVKSVQRKDSSSASVSNMSGNRKRELPSFWLPSMCPDSKKSKLCKPDKVVYCPMSGKPLKVKELVDVQWTEVKDPDNKKSMISREDRYQCAVTGDTLYNSTPCAVLRTTGDVVKTEKKYKILLFMFCIFQVTVECVEKIIKKDWTHPLTGQTLSQKDIIPIVRGATGFSAANDQLLAEKERPTNAIS